MEEADWADLTKPFLLEELEKPVKEKPIEPLGRRLLHPIL